MEMEGKFPRIRSGNGRSESPKVGGRKREEQEDQDEKPGKRSSAALDIASPGGGLLCGWPSSRIVRVSRASGGKDRHSKVWTSKGLRDRRVRLSVNTAIQFYDLQDRLGYDQPSKAVEWLLKAAAASIDELPSINTSFPGQDASNEKIATEMKMAEELYQHHNQQQQKGSNFSKSACSSTSETSKGSGLSLSRCESRMKARERARGRAAEKEKEKEHHNVSQSSFTDLLTGVKVGNGNSPASPNRESPASSRQWCSAPMDYFAAGMLGLSSTPSSSANLLGQIHTSQLFNVPAEHYSFLPDHLANNGTGTGNGCDYNLNFTISPSGYAGFNRGTLQSNSSSIPHQHQRFPSSSSSLFTGATAPPVEDHHHHHHFLPGFDARLQLCYGDSDQKGKVKN